MERIPSRTVRLIWLIVVWAFLLVVLLVGLVAWPGHSLSILYSLPILVAAVYESPIYVNVVGSLTVVLALVGLDVGRTPAATWPATILGLVGVIYLSNILAFHNHEWHQREKWHQSVLGTAQELRQLLTIILGYTQVLYARPDLERSARDQILIRIEAAARRAGGQVLDLLRALS